MTGGKTRVYLGIGSNRDDRKKYLDSAVSALAERLSDIAVSPYFISEPMYYTDQDRFMNCVVTGLTGLDPRELLKYVNEIEARFGRNRPSEIRNGPRTIDIDILLYGERLIAEKDLVIPHPRMTERQFVLVPLLTLGPELLHPGTGIPFSRYLSLLPDQGIYSVDPDGYSGSCQRNRGQSDER